MIQFALCTFVKMKLYTSAAKSHTSFKLQLVLLFSHDAQHEHVELFLYRTSLWPTVPASDCPQSDMRTADGGKPAGAGG